MSAERIVVGVGNEMRGDDAAGLLVARRLDEQGLDGVAIAESGGEAAGLIETWAGAGQATLVDAVSSGAEPGTLHRFDPRSEPLPTSVFNASSHAFGVAEAVALARELDRLPDRIAVYGIEGADFELGAGLSPAVEAAVIRLADELRRELGG